MDFTGGLCAILKILPCLKSGGLKMDCVHGRLNQGNIIMPLTAVMVVFGGAMDALHKSLLGLALPHRETLLACPTSVLTTTKTWTGFLTALMASCLAISALADMERPGLNLIGAMKSLMRARISSLLRNPMTRVTGLFLFQKKC